MQSMSMNPVGERPPVIADIVYRRIHEAITSQELKPGTLLTEQGLADLLEVSKTPVREAFLRLRQVGLIEPDGRRGLRVIRLSPEGLRQALEVREALEIYVTARAAERASAPSRRKIRAFAEKSLEAAEAHDVTGFQKYNNEFHDEIASTVDNPQIRDQIDNAIAQVQTVISEEFEPDTGGMVDCAKSHVRIAKAIEAGAAESAAREMAAHLRQIHNLIVASKL